jgi:NAD(P)-dependent dehydrogenase (short-subunit alcohol dehydrogenase family)
VSGVIITGAGGAASAGVIEAFLDGGWRVAGTIRHDPPPDATPGVHWVHADLSDSESTRSGVEAAVAQLGGLDALVCLAGGFGTTPVEAARWDDYAAHLDRSYRSTVEAVLATLPHLAEGGAIVTIGAKTAQTPGPRVTAYAAAKAAVIAFSASLAAELRPRGIRVNCVLPGTIDTPANRESMPKAKTANWVTPRQLGELIRHLASPESAPLTGAAIPIG